jgi:serine/threonine-protein kinase
MSDPATVPSFAGSPGGVTADLRRICVLGEGGMGVVELAMLRDQRFRRFYAVKRPHPEQRRDPQFRAMFADEGRVSGLLRHPNVVSVLAVGEDADGPYLVMDYVEGVSVATIIKDARPADRLLPLPLCLVVGAQIARGLHAAHALKDETGRPLDLVHRDVSPQNVLVGFDGVARLTDFGIAKAFGNVNRTTTGVLKGNVSYMSPEQLRFRKPDRRSDLFSFGVVLYEMLTRERLYRASGMEEVALRILEEPPPDVGEFRTDLPPELGELMFELLAKAPEDRPADALGVAQRLEALLRPLEGVTRPFDVEAYLAEQFPALRAARTREIEEGLRRLEASAPATDPAGRSTDRSERDTALDRGAAAGPPRHGAAVLAAAALAAAITGGLWLVRCGAVAPVSTEPLRVWAGAWHTCAVRAGELACWGKNTEGQLGDGTTTDSVVPRAVESNARFVSGAAGESHTCAVTDDGRVFCWGAISASQPGQRAARRPQPVAGLAGIQQVAAGARHTCAVSRAGTVACWGSNDRGQLGRGDDAAAHDDPRPVAGLDGVTQLDASGEVICARRRSGQVLCWGNNDHAQMGRAPPTDVRTPASIAGLPPARAVTVGRTHACALIEGGTVSCWGGNTHGQLGRGLAAGAADPIPAVVPGLSDAVGLAAGSSFNCALLASGAVTCWGRADWGNMGDGIERDKPFDQLSPTRVLDINDAAALAPGYQHACAARRAGAVTCWGLNATGQLGDATRKNRARPTSVVGL